MSDKVYWFTSDKARIDALVGEDTSIPNGRPGAGVKCKLVNGEAWIYDKFVPQEPYRLTSRDLFKLWILLFREVDE
jgi:hypothetical protein